MSRREDNWIMCSDELPEEDDEYLVIWEVKSSRGTPLRFYEIQEYYTEEGWVINIPQAGNREVKIIAWQELPAIPEED